MLPVDQGGEGLTIRAVMARFDLTKNRVERHLVCIKGKPERREPQSERRPKDRTPDTGHRTEKADSRTGEGRAEAASAEERTAGQTGQAPDNAARAHSSEESTFRARTWHIADL